MPNQTKARRRRVFWLFGAVWIAAVAFIVVRAFVPV